MIPALLAVSLSLGAMPLMAAESVVIKPLRNTPADFIKGADISTLLEVERQGAVFYDENHTRVDPVALLKKERR
ncbi:hypothetical protein DaDZ19_41000 [Dickeya ananatis]